MVQRRNSLLGGRTKAEEARQAREQERLRSAKAAASARRKEKERMKALRIAEGEARQRTKEPPKPRRHVALARARLKALRSPDASWYIGGGREGPVGASAASTADSDARRASVRQQIWSRARRSPPLDPFKRAGMIKAVPGGGGGGGGGGSTLASTGMSALVEANFRRRNAPVASNISTTRPVDRHSPKHRICCISQLWHGDLIVA